MEAFYKDKKVLIVGAGGMIGSLLAKKFSSLGSQLHLVFHSVPQNTPSGVQTSVLDLRLPESWDGLVDADIIFHLAAHESKNFEPVEDFEVNARSVLDLLETCRVQKRSPKIVFASSSNVVGAPDRMPVDESFKDNPLTLFAIHKLLAEEYLKLYAQDFNIYSIILRLANVYGPSTDKQVSLHSALNKMVNNAVGGQPLKLFANKDKIRDFLYIDDAVDAYLAAGMVQDPKGEIYVVGSEEGETFENIVALIKGLVAKATGKNPEIVIEKDQIASVEMRNFVANASRFKKVTGWKPGTSLKEGLQKTIDYFITVKQ